MPDNVENDLTAGANDKDDLSGLTGSNPKPDPHNPPSDAPALTETSSSIAENDQPETDVTSSDIEVLSQGIRDAAASAQDLASEFATLNDGASDLGALIPDDADLKAQDSSDRPSGKPGRLSDAAAMFDLPEFSSASAGGVDPRRVSMLSDVNLRVRVELGRTRMLVEDVLRLTEGAVVELDKLAGDPVDVFVNDRLLARGEVLVLNDSFCVRINEVLTHDPHRVTG